MEPFQRRLEAVPPQADDRVLGLPLALADDVEPRLTVLAGKPPGPAPRGRALVISRASGPPSGSGGLAPRLTAIQS